MDSSTDPSPPTKKKKSTSPSFDIRRGTPLLSISKFKSFIFLILTNTSGTINRPAITLKGPRSITKVVYCYVGGLTRDMFPEVSFTSQSVNYQFVGEKVPFLTQTFDDLYITEGPADKNRVKSPIESLVKFSMTKRELNDAVKLLKNTPITIDDLCLTANEIIIRGLPVHSQILSSSIVPDDWVETKPLDREPKVFALDCEFCQINSGNALTRISIVDDNGDVVMDKYVKPAEAIIDYKTMYSGITEDILKDVTTTLQDVQKEFVDIISSNDTLLGHSLESDLNIIKVRHPKIVDTAHIYHDGRGNSYSPSLKWLTRQYLGRMIQDGNDGHSSVQDAIAVLELVKVKVKEGLLHGILHPSLLILDKLNAEDRDKDVSILLLAYDAKDLPVSNSITGTVVKSDDEVVERFVNSVDDHDIHVMTLRELEPAKGWSSHCKVEGKSLDTSYEELNTRLAKIYSSLPENTAFIVSGTYGSDVDKINTLKRIKARFDAKQRDGEDVSKLGPEDAWDFDKESELKQLSLKSKENVSFIKFKT